MSAALQDHPEYRALVAAVRAAASDDLPRLVLADWIEEHGDPAWAEFVRVECEFERNPVRDNVVVERAAAADEHHQRGKVLYRRAKVLWEQVTACDGLAVRTYRRIFPNGRFVVQPDFSPSERPTDWRFEFRRGFVDRVACRLSDWTGGDRRAIPAPLLVRRHPVSWVRVTDKHPRQERSGWLWSPGGAVGESALPQDVFRRLPGGRMYPDQLAAEAALSVALLAWAEANEPRPPGSGVE